MSSLALSAMLRRQVLVPEIALEYVIGKCSKLRDQSSFPLSLPSFLEQSESTSLASRRAASFTILSQVQSPFPILCKRDAPPLALALEFW